MTRTARVVIQTIWSSRFRAAFAVLTMSGMLFIAVDSKACALPTPGKSPVAAKIPFQEVSSDGQNGDEHTIVGLWHTVYTTSDNQPFIESLKVWHRDGTEFENAYLPPAGGNVCMGVWRETEAGTVKLHHVGLMFDPTTGKLAGTFTNDETDTLGVRGIHYKGTFTFRQYDTTGKLEVTITGTILATRITVD
jgi:hypothetical protein